MYTPDAASRAREIIDEVIAEDTLRDRVGFVNAFRAIGRQATDGGLARDIEDLAKRAGISPEEIDSTATVL